MHFQSPRQPPSPWPGPPLIPERMGSIHPVLTSLPPPCTAGPREEHCMKAPGHDQVSGLSLVSRSFQNAHTSSLTVWVACFLPGTQVFRRGSILLRVPAGFFQTYSPKVALEPKGTGRARGDETPRSRFGLAHPVALAPAAGQSQRPPSRGAGSPPRLRRSPPPPRPLPAGPSHPGRPCTPRPHAQASRTQPLRARSGHSALHRLAPRALSAKGLLALGPGAEDGGGPRTSFSKAPLGEQPERGELWIP